MKLLGVINDNNYLKYLDTGLSGIIMPLANFAVDYFKYYDLDDIKKYKSKTNKLCFVVINKMIFNKDLNELLKVLKTLEKIKIDGIFFYDLAILQIVKDYKLDLNLIINQTHMILSSDIINFYYNNYVKGAYLSNEITKDEVINIRNNTKSDLFMLLVGRPSVAMSKRKLLTSYFKSRNDTASSTLKIVEPVSKQKFLVKEDSNGTTFFYDKKLNASSSYLVFKDIGINFGILSQDDLSSEAYLNLINNFINFNKEGIDKIVGRNRGFLHRKTIYRVKK